MEQDILKSVTDHMEKSIRVFEDELAKIRAGRPTAALFEGIKADHYGVQAPIHTMATISIPDPRQVIIKPWDKNTLPSIEKALQTCELSLNPTNDGHLIRIPIPPLSAERREEYVKLAHSLTEKAKISIRNIRRDANEQIKKALKNSEISEEAEHRLLTDIQSATDEKSKHIDRLKEKKEREILER